ncbi:winged helix-turn-helix domain-containing protein [Catenuloplanes japonicus]|uniref:winged helix-turn-helix domain-containing protein n=1 Tax=Catenuloplanes japonicus TaxID=33876 RepID=UPI000AF1481D|nr:winged helix-turn-helix domain-containing protein [Catenuloplanes japonicus]
MAEIPVTSLTIGIAATPDDRRRLARLLGDTEAFLIVSSVDQARKFLDIVSSPESPADPAAVSRGVALLRDADPGSVAGDAVFAGGVAGDAVIARGLTHEAFDSTPHDAATPDPVLPVRRADVESSSRRADLESPARGLSAESAARRADAGSPLRQADVQSPTRPGGTESADRRTGTDSPARQVQSPVRRTSPDQPSGLRVDSDRRVLRWQDREIDLTPLEHDFLNCLVASPGQVWTYKRLHLEVWGNEHLGRGSDLHSVVRRIRRKLTWLGTSASIQSVRGVGFRFASH